MKTIAQTPFAERAGRALGRTWQGFMRLERKANVWLVAQGMNATLATGILWVVRIALLAILLYGAFWVALLLAFAYTGAWMARNTDWEQEEELKPEWKEGCEGFGLYNKSEWRIDLGNFDEP